MLYEVFVGETDDFNNSLIPKMRERTIQIAATSTVSSSSPNTKTENRTINDLISIIDDNHIVLGTQDINFSFKIGSSTVTSTLTGIVNPIRSGTYNQDEKLEYRMYYDPITGKAIGVLSDFNTVTEPYQYLINSKYLLFSLDISCQDPKAYWISDGNVTFYYGFTAESQIVSGKFMITVVYGFNNSGYTINEMLYSGTSTDYYYLVAHKPNITIDTVNAHSLDTNSGIILEVQEIIKQLQDGLIGSFIAG